MAKSTKIRTKPKKSIVKLLAPKGAQAKGLHPKLPQGLGKMITIKVHPKSGELTIASSHGGTKTKAITGRGIRRLAEPQNLGRSALTGQYVLKPASTGGSVSSAKVRQAIRSVIAAS